MDIYLLVKWWHLVAMVSWMAGILYLIRLYVYHSTEEGQFPQVADLLSVMERRLGLFILRPSMALTWITGLSMVMMNPSLGHRPWFMAKLLCVVLLSGISEMAVGYRRRLKEAYGEADQGRVVREDSVKESLSARLDHHESIDHHRALSEKATLQGPAKNSVKRLYSPRALKWINEIPTVLMIIIIALVILRPWSL